MHGKIMMKESLADDEMQALCRPLGEAHGLPGRVYTDPGYWQLERERLFRQGWFAVGCASDVPNPGDVMPITIAGWELVLVRGTDDRVRCFHNLCRHRGTRLVRRPGNVRNIVCGWHCWTYSLDGALLNTPIIAGPRTREHDSFRREDLGLVEIRTALWNDTAFVNIDGRARDFASFCESFTKLLERYGPEDFDYRSPEVGEEVVLDINWKLYHEGGLEGYHLPFVHPALEQPERYQVDNDPLTYTSLTGWLSRYRRLGAWVDLPDDTLDMNQAASAAVRAGEKIPYTICFVTPTLIFAIWPEAVVLTLLRPISETRTGVRRNFYFVGGKATAPAAAPARAKYNEIWLGVTQEDQDFSEGVQRLSRQRDELGVSTRFSPFWEEAVRLFQRRIAEQAYAKEPAGTP